MADRIAEQREPGRAETVLIAKGISCPLRRAPGGSNDDTEHNRDLTDIDFRWKHSPPHSPAQRRRRDENGEYGEPSIEI
jgi:hypothetical protein